VSTAKDKGKAKMDESESETETAQTKTKLEQEQERLSYEVAVRLQAELEEEERVEADEELAQRLQAKEREMYTESEQARLLVELSNHRKRTRKYWKIIRVGNHTEVHKFFDDMLKAFEKDDLVMSWSLVKEKFNSTKPTDDKEREIWVKLKRFALCVYREGSRHLHTGREGVSIIKGNSYINDGCKAHGKQANERSRALLRQIFMSVNDQEAEVGSILKAKSTAKPTVSTAQVTTASTNQLVLLDLKENDILSLEKHVTTEEVYDALMQMAPTKAPRPDVSYSFNTNGKVTSHVTLACGLRQRDPISPYLFIMYAEVLSSMIRKSVTQGHIYGIKVCRGAPVISHLLSGKVINYEKPEVSFGANVEPYVRTHIIESLKV
ncbi:hypothetical protein Tco_0748784, partial [Tanacetum coccineum]